MEDKEYNEKIYKLEVYNALYKAYADEIRNLWQRSAFLGAFMTLAWGGYGALQLKMIEKCLQNICAYHFASLGLCAVIIILSLLWVAMAKGSKFVQEAHEAHIAKYNIKNWLFCDLGKYQKGCYDTQGKKRDFNSNLFFNGELKAYRYSPSKINIALGCFSFFVGFLLIICHTIFAVSLPIFGIHYVCFICYLLIAIVMFAFIVKCRKEKFITFEDLKGGKQC